MIKTSFYILIVTIVILLTGCSENKNNELYRPSGELITKKVYVVGIHPYLNSKMMYNSYRPIFDYLEEKIENTSFVIETSTDYAAYNVKLYKGDFHFSLPNPFQTYNSLEHNYKVIAKMKPDNVFRGILVARKDSKLTNVQQLKNKAVSFPAPTALAATMMPLYYLYENGLDINTIEKKYVGSQYSSILNAYSSDTIAGATWPPPWESWAKENPDKAKEMEVIWQTEPLINNGFVVRDDVDKKLSAKVAKLLNDLDKTKTGKQMLENAGFEGFEYSSNTDYLVVKNFLKKYDKAIGIPK